MKITSKFLINYIQIKKGKAFWKETLEGLLTIVRFDVFHEGMILLLKIETNS